MKRFKVRNSFALVLLAALIIPILAACGGSTQTPPAATAPAAAAPTAAPAATAAPAPTAAPEPTAAPAEPTAAPAEPTAATSATPAGNTLRMAEATWPDTLAPQKSSFSNEIAVLILNYEGLTRFDKDL